MKTLIHDSIEDLEAALKNSSDLRDKFRTNSVEGIKNIETRNLKDNGYYYTWIGYDIRSHSSFFLKGW